MSKVYLVGAGPGDPELITSKGRRALEAADCVLYDHLANEALLDLAPAHAERLYVGKKKSLHAFTQDEICAMLIDRARRGLTVVRLKGGDPFIFGRGGEEAETLRAAGIDCEIVNGITSGLAAATSAGVPLTHRAHSRGVIFVTAHTAAGDAPDWRALAASGMTLVVYMGVSRCEDLQASLIGGGLAPSTPVAVVQDATLARERQMRTTLSHLAADIAANEIESPAIMVIGEVARGDSADDFAGCVSRQA